MRKTAFLCALSVCLLFCSCNPKISTQLTKQATPLGANQDVTIIGLDNELPSNGEVLGKVSIGDAGLTTNCSYETVLELAKVEARRAGGNALKITKHTEPDMYSSCHRITATILLIDSESSRQLVQRASEQPVRQIAEQSARKTSYLPSSQPVITSDSLAKKTDFSHRLSVYGGFSQLIGKNPGTNSSILDQYTDNLKSGYNIGADLTYYYSHAYGFGIKCNMLRTSNSLNDVYITDDNGHSQIGNISDDMTYLFLGPAFCCRKIGTDNKGTLFLSAAAGYNYYYDNAYVIRRIVLEGSTLGTSIDMGYDFNLSKKVALSLKATLTTGLLKKITIDNEKYSLERDSYVSLNHFDLSVGFSFLQ